MSKIAFLVGGLEPGANGVGDYARLLAHAVERAQPGAHCCLVSLADPHVAAPQIEGDGMAQLRLPANLPWPARIEEARRFLDEFAPDWLSLHFVPYSFHPKGIVRDLAAQLQPLLTNRRLHIMFHELWIGDNLESPFKETAVGSLQRHFVLRMIRQLRPDAVSTSNGVYVATLQSHGVPAQPLPLFSNIPIVDNAEPAIESAFDALWQGAESGSWTGVFFGSLHPTWQPQPLLDGLIEAAKGQNKRLRLIAVGRLGAAGETLWGAMARDHAARATFENWGEQPSELISLLFGRADFGVATSPWQLIEKSSCVASMLGHGLPVVVNRDDWHWRGRAEVVPPADPLLHRFVDASSAPALLNLTRRAPKQTLPAVAAEFTRQLNASAGGS